MNQSYIDQEKIFCFCLRSICIFCKRTVSLEEELRKKGFNAENANVKKWFLNYFQRNKNEITIFPALKWAKN